MMLLFALFAAVSAKRPRWHELEHYDFEKYAEDFSKTYASPLEAAERRLLFEARLASVRAHNAKRTTWKRGVNWLSDRHDHEIPKGLVPRLNEKNGGRVFVEAGGQKPDEIDWRLASPTVVTPVKNQASCGSCWAFAATECIESALALATGHLLVLAPQVWVDCAPNPDKCGGTGGCAGATAEIAYATAQAYGAFNESDVPYVAHDEACSLASLKPAANISGFVSLSRNNYTQLIAAVANGPVAVSVDASWTDYETGVFPAVEGGTDIDHAVQLVGYGTQDSTGTPYWLIRNSWGQDWGEDGYIRLERDPDGGPCAVDNRNEDGFGCRDDPSSITVCGTSGVLSDSSFPIGATLL